MDNILDKPTSEKIAEILSPARRIRRGTVASMRAKFENFGRAECETDDSENKKELKRLKIIGLRPQTSAKKKGKTRGKQAKKTVPDPLQ